MDIKYIVRRVEVNRGVDVLESHPFDDVIEAIEFISTKKDGTFSYWEIVVEHQQR